MADDFGIRPARDPYPPSEPVAKARDAAIERAEAEIRRLRDALEAARSDIACRMLSDDYMGDPFDEDLGEALARIDVALAEDADRG